MYLALQIKALEQHASMIHVFFHVRKLATPRPVGLLFIL